RRRPPGSPLPPPHSPPSSLTVLFVTPECAPLVKTGGLGDVRGALPPAFAAAGVDVRVMIPAYTAVLERTPGAREIAKLTVLGHAVRLLEARLTDSVPLIL